MLALKNNHSLSDISFPCVYGNVLSKTKMVKSDISKLGKSMENLKKRSETSLVLIVSYGVPSDVRAYTITIH
jgi:hypothetical protein